MSELFRYPDGTTERRYTHMEARLVLAIRAVVMVISLPFLLVVYSTTLFDVALVVAFLVAATLLFAVLWLRARRRAGRPPSGTPAVAEWKEEPASKAEKSTEGGSGPSSADRKSGGPGSSS